jgi:hypothetical protein
MRFAVRNMFQAIARIRGLVVRVPEAIQHTGSPVCPREHAAIHASSNNRRQPDVLLSRDRPRLIDARPTGSSQSTFALAPSSANGRPSFIRRVPMSLRLTKGDENPPDLGEAHGFSRRL